MRWRRVNRSKKRVLADGRSVPDPNEEYLLYQTLVGAWPMDIMMSADEDRQQFIQRIQQYMEKALHEAKVNLSWINTDPDYVAGVNEFIARILTPGTRSKTNFFLESMQEFLPTVQYFGAINSLAQTLLKITSPGVPDVYQGTELWDFSLVDPDNRRPVNFAERRETLSDLESQASSGDLLSLCTDLLDNYSNGRIKLWTTMRALQFRRDNPELFRASPYLPIDAIGEKQEHVISFAREASSAPVSGDQTTVIVAVPRFAYTLMKGRIAPPVGDAWGDTELLIPPHAPNYFENVLTGEMVKVTNKRTLLCREVFANFPVALLSAR
jgi:(1->4)-alpha-D-glucan 1-alpha-D-glucosylmutase